MDEFPKTESIIANCLNCQGLVRVPVKAPANSTVRCPRCSISYTLAQILNETIPELELISEEPAEIVPRVDQVLPEKKDVDFESQKFVVPIQLAKGAQRTSRRRRSSESNGSGSRSRRRRESSSSTDKRAPDPGPAEHPRLTDSSNHSPTKTRKRGGFPEVLKIALGGFLAIPIAYLLIMWIFNKDPLNVAPSIGKTIPFVVPESLRAEKDPNEPETTGDLEPDSDASSIKPLTGLDLLKDIESNGDDGDIFIPNVDPESLGK